MTRRPEPGLRALEAIVEEARLARVEAERVRAELEAILDASDTSILVFGLDGALLRANRRARERFPELFGALPRTLADLRALAGATHADGTPIGPEWEAAARGQELELIVNVRDRQGCAHWIHAHVAGVRDPAGTLTAVVLVTRDITELHEAIAARARLDGAVLTARRAAHELNNQLAPLVGYGEILLSQIDGPSAELAAQMHASAVDAARTLAQLQRIIRFEQTEFGGQPMLDLEAATDAGRD